MNTEAKSIMGTRRIVSPRARSAARRRVEKATLVHDGKTLIYEVRTASSRDRETVPHTEAAERHFLQMLSETPVPHHATRTWQALFSALEKVHDETQDAFAARLLHACADLIGYIGQKGQLDVLAAPTSVDALLRFLQTPEAQTALRASDPFAPARARWLQDQQDLLRAEGGVLTTDQLATALGISREGVRQRSLRGRLLALPVGHALYFPVWQFQDTQSYATLPGLPEVLGALRHEDAWGKAVFLLGGDPSLGDERPLDYLRRGDTAPVLAAARVYGEQGAR